MADDDEQRKSTSRQIHNHLDEERTSVMLAMYESEGEEEEDMSEFSDDDDVDEDYQGFIQSGIEGDELEYLEDYDYNNYEEIEEDDIDPDELSYEELIALGDTIGVESRGLSEAEISNSLHPSNFQSLTSKTLIDRCVVCQVEYDEGEKLVSLPCNHQYHCDCITTWLQIKKVCPICNNEVSSPPKTPNKTL